MKNNTFASYIPGSFCIDLNQIEIDPNTTFFYPQDYPSYIHEWMHYIQDISTISAINGYYLMLRDLSEISKITCNGVGKTIILPLGNDEKGLPRDKNYNLFLFQSTDCEEEYVKEESFSSPIEISRIYSEVKTYDKYTEPHRLPYCWVYVNGKKKTIGIAAVQEMNSFYAQRLVEHMINETPNEISCTKVLKTYPYKIGDLLFEKYNIKCSDEVKFLITYLCLDSLHPVPVFKETLEHYENTTIDFRDTKDITETIGHISTSHCPNNQEILSLVEADLKQLIREKTEIQKPIQWYIDTIERMNSFKLHVGQSSIIELISRGFDGISLLTKDFPPPILLKESKHYSLPGVFNTEVDYNNASILWSLKTIFKILTIDSIEDLQKSEEDIPLTQCPFFEFCEKKTKDDNGYFCKTALFSILEGESKADCSFGCAIHTMGLWQNKLKIE